VSARKRDQSKLDPNRELPEDIRRLQDPNFTHADFMAALRKVVNAKPKDGRKR
jgi:hypothetical protein